MHYLRLIVNLVVIASMPLILMVSVVAQEDTSREPIRCVSLSRIQKIEVLDNRNIVFQMRGNDYYLNILPYSCNSLRPNDPIMFRTSIDKVCDVDVITVINNIGPGFQPGISCGLGRFNPTNPDEINRLRELLGQ